MGINTANMKLVLIAACIVAACHAQSVKSCGSSSDVLQNAVFTVSPDPIVKGSPLTITGSGTLSAAVVGGTLAVDINIKALGIINEPVKLSVPFSLSPGLVAGPSKVVIGPLTLPKIPGSVELTGTVKGTDAAGKEIFCVALDVSSISEAEVIAMPESAPVVKNCGSNADHLKNLKTSVAAGVSTVTGTLDEDVSSGIVPVDLVVKVLFFKIPIKLTVPFSISPGIPKGDIKASVGPVATVGAQSMAPSKVTVSVDGTIKVNDANSQEIACISLSASTAEVTATLMPEWLALNANASHYEDPKPNGCQTGELAIQIQGVAGDFCSPKCAGTTCPSDVPAGVTATPQCALQDQSGNKYCALICSPSASADTCGKATCKSIQGTGICTYDDR